MLNEIENWCAQYKPYAPTVLRVLIGIIFALHGYGKVIGSAPGIEGFTGMLAGLGIPFPGLMAWVVGLIELLGGIALILGFMTRISAKLLAIIMVVAILTVHLGQGFEGLRYPIAMLAASLSLAMSGPGELAVDKKEK